MASKIRHIRSSIPGKIPDAGQLEVGQIAINTADGKIFTKKDNGDIVAIQAVDPGVASASIFQGDSKLEVNDYDDSTVSNITATIEGVEKVVIDLEGTTFNGPITVNGAETLRFNDADNNQYIGIQAPDSADYSYIIKLPQADSIDPAVLATDGTGQTYWGRPDAFGGNRVYVSDKYGDDLNDGVTGPVRSLNRATQVAADLSYRPKVDPGRDAENAKKLLRANKEFVKEEVIAFIEANFVNFHTTFDQDAYSNELDEIIRSVIDDYVFGTNYRTIQTAIKLSETYGALHTAKQEKRYLDGINYCKTLVLGVFGLSATSIAAYTLLFDGLITILKDAIDDATAIQAITFTNSTAIVTVHNSSALLQANKEFIAAEQIAWIETQIAGGTSPFNAGLSYSQEQWRNFFRDVVNALTYDLEYNGNTATVNLADLITIISVENIAEQEPQFRAAISFLATYIDDIVKSQAIAGPQQEVVTQVTGTAGSDNDVTTLTTLLTTLNNRTYQDTNLYPVTLTAPSYLIGANTTPGNTDRALVIGEISSLKQNSVLYIDTKYPGSYDEAEFRNDFGLVIDAVGWDSVLGTNYNTITAGLAYTRETRSYLINYQKIQTVESLKHAKLLSNTALSGSALAQFRSDTGYDEIIYIVENQVTEDGSTRSMQYPSPVGVDPTRIEAKDILQDKKVLIQNRTIQYLAQVYPSLVYDSVKCRRDVGYIIDALCYDIVYQGNQATVYNAQAYYENAVAQLPIAQRAATIDAYTQLKGWIQGAIEGTDFTDAVDPSGNPVDPDITTPGAPTGTGTGTGPTGAPTGATGTTGVPPTTPVDPIDPELLAKVTILQELVDVIIVAITSGTGTIPAIQYPVIDWVNSTETNARDNLLNQKAAIQISVIQYIEDNFTGFIYNEEKCARDVGYIIDAVSTDLVLNTNFNSVTAGSAYARANASFVISDQLEATLGAITYAKQQAALLSSVASDATAFARSNANFDIILDILENGLTVAPAISYAIPTGATVGEENSLDQLQANRAFFIAEVTAYIDANYPSLVYDVDKCERDVGFIVDALSHDIIYGGNTATRIAADAYFVGTISQLGDGERTATINSYEYLSTIIGQAVVNTDVSELQVVVSQDSSSGAGTSTEVTALATLMDIIIDVIANNATSGMPPAIYPDFAFADDALELARTDMLAAKTTIATGTITWIAQNIGFNYNADTCKRDVGLIVDAVAYDLVLGGNKKTVEGGLSYLSIAKVINNQLFQTTKAIEFTRDVCVQGVLTNTQYVPFYRTVAPVQTLYTNLTTTSAISKVQGLFDGILLILTRPAKTNPSIVGTSTVIASYNSLQDAKTVIQSGTTRFIKGTYSGFVYNVSTCERDIGLIIDAICYDLVAGSNYASIVAGRSYLRGTASVVTGTQQPETLSSFLYAKGLSLDYVDINERATVAALWDIIYDILNTGESAIPTVLLPDNSYTPIDASNSVTAWETNKATYVSAVTSWISSNYPNLTYDSVACERDTGYLIDAIAYDIMYGGNAETFIAADAYYSFGVLQLGSALEKQVTLEAYTYLKSLMVADAVGGETITRVNSLFADALIIIEEGDIPDIIEPRFDIIPITISISAGDFYVNNPVIVPDFVTVIGDSIRSVVLRPLNSGKDMFRVRNGTYIFGVTFKDALNDNNIPTYTFDWAIAFDDPADTSIDRSEYFGIGNTKPIITTSPYIQNCSIISFLGANGAKVDGSKIQTPNVSNILEEAETPVNFGDGIPEQGKSMVSNAFTTLSFGGTGWLVINDAYAQIVSCFQIFMLNGTYAQSGGYISITNSASNFGLYALRASGYSQSAFIFDRGFIVASGFDGGNTFTTIGTGRAPIEQFVLRIRDIDDNTDITNDYKQATTTVTFDAATGVNPTTDIFTIAGHGFTNGQGVYYSAEGNVAIPGMFDQGLYFINIIDLNTFRLFNDNGLDFATVIEARGIGTHSFTINSEEFIVGQNKGRHNNYQTLRLATGQGLGINSFTVGQPLLGDTAGFENTAFVYSWDSVTRDLVVSNEGTNIGAQDPITIRFEDTSTIVQVGGALISPAYTIEAGGVTNRTDKWTATFVIDSTVSNNVIQNPATAVGNAVSFHRPSVVNSSSHTWEYSGSGIDYNALPQNGGVSKGTEYEQYSELPGRVYASGTNELGDFKVGNFITAENKSGEITFNARVTVGELAVLRLSLSDVNIEEFSTDVGLGDNELGGAKNNRVSTQLAIRSFIANRLGNVVDKNVSSNAVPGAVVQLNSAGQINQELLPPARGVTTYNVDGWNNRLELSDRVPAVQVIAGDNASETYQQVTIVTNSNITVSKGDIITQTSNPSVYAVVKTNVIGNTVLTLVNYEGTFNTTNTLIVNGSTQAGIIPSTVNAAEEVVDNYFMKSDTISQRLILDQGTVYDFTNTTTIIGANSGAQGTITDGPTYGVIGSLNYATFTAGSGYTPAVGSVIYFDVPLTGGSGTGARADITVTSGVIENVTLVAAGIDYEPGDTLSASASTIGGTGIGFSINVATIQTVIEVDLGGGFIKFSASDASPEFVQDDNAPTKTITDLTDETVLLFNGADTGNSGDVTYSTSTFNITAHGLANGDAIKYSRNANPVVGNLIDGETYWVQVITVNSFKLYNNYGFTGGSAVTLGGSTSGNHVFTLYTVAIDVDTVNLPAHGFSPGDIVRFQAADAPGGLLDQTTYFIGSVTTNSFTLHTTESDALSSTSGTTVNSVDITDIGTGSATLVKQNVAIIGTVNTSSNVETNWGIIASSNFDASNIVSGVIDPGRLAPEGSAADNTFLRLLNGNSAWVLAVQNIRPQTNSPISVTGNFFTDPGDGFNKYYEELALDIDRASDLLGDANYTNLGVVATNKLQFSTTNGQISIKSGVIDAGFLGGQAGNYYTNPSNFSASVPINKGGTGLTSFTRGDLIYSGSTDSLTNLSIGPVNSVLFSDGTVPQWTTSPTFGGSLTVASITAINSTSVATNYQNGALRVGGGVGIAGDVYTNGIINTKQVNIVSTSPTTIPALTLRSNMEFQSGDGASVISVELDQAAGGLVFNGAAGQLLTITDSLIGTIFSINNASKTLVEGNDNNEVILTPTTNTYTIIGTTTNNGVDKLQVTGNSRFTGNITSTGTITGVTKNFTITHPTKPGMKLSYGSIEGPYHAVRLTGEAKVVNGECVVTLPDYIHGLVREQGVNVQITNVRHGQVLWVESVDVTTDQFIVKTDNAEGEFEFYWTFTAVRKDVPELITEYKY